MNESTNTCRASAVSPRIENAKSECGRAYSGIAITSATRGAPMINNESATGPMIKPDFTGTPDDDEIEAVMFKFVSGFSLLNTEN
jgi:hypothetical protein